MTPTAYIPVPATEVNPILDEAIDRMIDGAITIPQAHERFAQMGMRQIDIQHKYQPPAPERWHVMGLFGETPHTECFTIEARSLPQLVEAGRIALEVR